MDATEQWVFTLLNFAVAAVLVVYLLRGRRGSELRFRALVLVGGTLCVLFEPLAEHLGGYWNHEDGLWTVFEAYGHSIPLWHVPVYCWFLGGLTLLAYNKLGRGCPASELWRLYAIFFAADVMLELPALHLTDLSTYYGNQPFFGDVVRLPLWYPAVNAAWPIVIACALHLLLSPRRPSLLVPWVMVAAAFANYAITAWPTWAALNSDTSELVSHLAGAMTIAFSLILVHVVTRAAIAARRVLPAPPDATAPRPLEPSGVSPYDQ